MAGVLGPITVLVLNATGPQPDAPLAEVGWEDLGYRHSAEGWERKPWWRRMLGL